MFRSKDQSKHSSNSQSSAIQELGFTQKPGAFKAIIFDCFGVLAEDGWLPFKRKYIGDNLELMQTISDLG